MIKSLLQFLFVLAIPVCLGCGNQPSPDAANSAADTPAADAPHEHAHDGDHAHTHPSHGPHAGELIELGEEEYHAELIHDDKSVTIYLLDSTATKSVPIEAKELTINLLHDGKPEQFKLAASPNAEDPAEKSSKFVTENAELATHLDDKAADAKLVVTINGKSYRASLSHDHDHAGHDHAH